MNYDKTLIMWFPTDVANSTGFSKWNPGQESGTKARPQRVSEFDDTLPEIPSLRLREHSAKALCPLDTAPAPGDGHTDNPDDDPPHVARQLGVAWSLVALASGTIAIVAIWLLVG